MGELHDDLAFPHMKSYMGSKIDGHEGLTKREYFAAAALAGLISDSRSLASMMQVSQEKSKDPIESLAIAAVSLADALITELGDSK